MHRSGTSALSGAFNILGANHGSSVMPAAPDNPKGYWEHAEIVAIHEKLFQDMSLSWDSTQLLPADWLELTACKEAKQKLISICERDFSEPGLHCIKDPRMCRLLPLWGEICEELAFTARFVFILRSPDEVAASIFERDGLSTERSLYLWALHIFDVVGFIAGRVNHVLTYENLLDNPVDEMSKVINSLKLSELVDIDKAALSSFVSRKLQHQTARDLDSPAINAANAIYDLLKKNAELAESPELSVIRAISLPLFQALHEQRNELQSLLDGELNLVDYIKQDKTVLRSKLSSILEESKDYASNLLRENKKLVGYTQSLKESITEKDQFLNSLQENMGEKDLYVADLQQTVAEKDLYVADLAKNLKDKENELTNTMQILEADIEEKGKFVASLQSHLSASKEYAGQLEENAIEQNRESEEYSQSLLQSIREKDTQLDSLTNELTRVLEQQKNDYSIIAGLLEKLGNRMFALPVTLAKIKNDLAGILSSEGIDHERSD